MPDTLPDDRKRARQLMADKQLGVTFRFVVRGATRDVDYDGVGDFEIPSGAESFVLWTPPLGSAKSVDSPVGRAGPIEGPLANLREHGVEAMVVLALQRADVRLG